jgi:hypothetical protein
LIAGGILNESMPSGPANFSNGEHPIDFFNQWNCQSSVENVGGIYAFCCQN